MTHVYQYHIGQTVVPYTITYSEDRETISLKLDESMELAVTAPITATLEEIENTLDDRQEWILEKLYGLRQQADSPREKEFMSGEKLSYRGRRYPLHVVETGVEKPELSFDGHEFELEVHEFDKDSDRASILRKQDAIKRWYKTKARSDLPPRTKRFTSKLGIDEIDTSIDDLDGKWGVYEDSAITLNWRLIMAPVRIQDYVIVHELAHEIHEEHDKVFWNTVGSVIPDYEERREWLRLNGNTLTI